MKPGRLSAAALLLAALLGGYYLFDQVWLAGKEAQKEKESLLLAVDPAKVEKIRISRPGLDPAEAVREKGAWKITSPIQTEADQETISAMINAAAGLTAERELDPAKDLAEYGLDAPAILEFIPEGGGKPARLSIGAKNPLSGQVYVMAGGRPGIGLISGMSAGDLDHSFFDLRLKKLYKNKVEDLAAFEFAGQGMERIRVERADGGKWIIVSPIKAPASNIAVEGLAGKFLSASAAGFYEEEAKDLSIYGLVQPNAEFTAYFAGQDQGARLALGSAAGEGGVFALWPGKNRVVRLQEDILKDLPRSILDVRLKELASFDFRDVRGLSIITADERLDIKRKPSQKGEPELWDITSPIRTAADPVNVSSLISSIKSVEAMGFAGGPEEEKSARAALDNPELRIELDLEKGPVNIRFAKSSTPERYWAGADGKSETLQVSQKAVEPLRKSVFELRERRLFKMPSSTVERVLIQRLGQEFELEKKGDDYMVVRPEKIKLKAEQWTEFLWSILELRFAGVISETRQKPDDPEFGKTVTSISIFGEGGILLERAEIAKAVNDDKWYKARLANAPGLFDVDWFYVEDDVTLALEKAMGINKKEEEQPALFR